jgi:hypothetical protein
VEEAIKSVLGPPQRAAIDVQHQPPLHFNGGEELRLAIAAPGATAVRAHYRHVDQAENYVSTDMAQQGAQWVAAIPAEYTRTEFPLEYYFEVRKSGGATGVYPGFSPRLTSQPYLVVRAS